MAIGNTFFFKAAIFIAVLISCYTVDAQEYNNWLTINGGILNFETSPATISCNKIFGGQPSNYTVMLSDDNGKIILYAYNARTNNETSSSVFVIKKKLNQTIVSTKCVDDRNIIGCRLPQGGYCIAAVIRTFYYGELHVYMFNKDGVLEKEYYYNDGNYTFFIDFIHLDNFIAFIAYKYGKIETYKLTSAGCNLWTTSDIILGKFSNFMVPYFTIDKTIDNSKIIATGMGDTYILNFDKISGKFSIQDIKRNETNATTFAFSKTDKYFLFIDNSKLYRILYNNDFNLKFENPELAYELPTTKEIECNSCWSMAIGVDGKLYVHAYHEDYIIVLDGIEEGNITEEIIKSECLGATVFPRIPKMEKRPPCRASVAFDNAIVCDGQPLHILSSGDAPFEIFYTIDGEEHSIKTSETEYQLPNIASKYQITKIIDASCEAVPTVNNTAEIAPKTKTLKIVEE